MSSQTLTQYHTAIATCKHLFAQKTKDYGSAWRVMRLPSFTDQIMIKAKRIRALQEQQTQRIPEGIDVELIGVVNYSIMALIQLALQEDERLALPYAVLEPLYDQVVTQATALLEDKNHDYQEAWRTMRMSSLVDIILVKLWRIKRIEDLGGVTQVSEGVAANYQDILNYAVFALIRLREQEDKQV